MAGDAVWLDVLPALTKFGSELAKGTTAAAQSAGKASGPAWAKSFEGAAGDAGTAKVVKELEGASKRTAAIVSQQTEAISKARASQKDAAAKVVEAEQKLRDAREKGDPAKIEAAELRLGAARDRVEASTKKFESTEGALKAAHAEHKTVVGQLEEATKELDGAQSGAARSAEDQARAIDAVKAGAKTAMVGIVALAAVAVTAGTALFTVGGTFDNMSDTIRVGTGAQGDALDALMDSAKNVATSVPTDLEKAGTTIADLNTRMGLSGSTLETVAAQVLEAGRMFGEDLNVKDVTASFNAFQVGGEDTVGAMDHLFRVSQATGIGMNELAQKVAAQAPAVQELGFSYEETASMVGALDKAGLNSEAVLGGMARSLVRLAKEGEQPADAFKRVVGEIEGFIAAGDSASAIDMAGKVFGTRGASQFIGAIESGALSMDELAKMSSATGDTILGASADTMDFAEQWQMFKNEVLIKLEPVATRVFNALSTGMAWLKDTGLPVFRNLADTAQEKLQPAFETIGGYVTGTLVPGFSSLVGWLKDNEAWLVPIAAAVVSMVVAYTAYTTVMKIVHAATVLYTAAQAALSAVMEANPIGIVVLLIVGLVAAFVTAYKTSETFRDIVQGVWQGIQTAASTAWEWMQGVFESLGTATAAVGLWFSEMGAGIAAAWEWIRAGAELGAQAIGAAWEWIRAAAATAWDFLFNTVLLPLRLAFAVLQYAVELGAQAIGAAWEWIRAAAATAWEWISVNVIDPFKAGLNVLGAAFDVVRLLIVAGWTLLSEGLAAGWLWINATVFDPIRAATGWVGDKFVEVGDTIGVAWQTLQDGLKTGWEWISVNVFDPLKAGVDAIRATFDTAQLLIAVAWAKIKEAAAVPVNFIIETVYTNGIKALWDKIATAVGATELKLPTVSPIKFAEGGVLPGYTPGRDVHHFFSPTGGRLDLSGGEGILRPDTLRNLGGKAWLDQANLSRGRSQSFADGGEVSFWDRAGGVVSSVGAGIRDLVVNVASILADPVGALKNMLSAPVEALLGQITGGTLGQMLVEVPRQAVAGIIAKAKDMIASMFGDAGEPGKALATIGGGGWVRPSSGQITSGYGSRWGAFHNGVDFGGNLPVYAAGAGRVRRTGLNVGYGNTGLGVLLAHGSGLETYYGHADPGEIKVRAGQDVTARQHISWGGNTGNSTGQHLHFSVFQNGRSLNPAQLGVFDDGGYFEPRTVAGNFSTKPEPVLTGRQWRDISALAARGAERVGPSFPSHVTLVDEDGGFIARTRVEAREVLAGELAGAVRVKRARGA